MKEFIGISVTLIAIILIGMVNMNPRALDAWKISTISRHIHMATKTSLKTPSITNILASQKRNNLIIQRVQDPQLSSNNLPKVANNPTSRARLSLTAFTNLPSDIGIATSKTTASTQELYDQFLSNPAYSKTGRGYNSSTRRSSKNTSISKRRPKKCSVSNPSKSNNSKKSGSYSINNSHGSTGNFDSANFATLDNSNHRRRRR